MRIASLATLTHRLCRASVLLPVLEASFHQIILAPSCFYAMGKAFVPIT